MGEELKLERKSKTILWEIPNNCTRIFLREIKKLSAIVALKKYFD
ncbi:hypothetical protein [Leptotrichia wadei]|nr:hypothetical protein [Leptotrichia wadei]